MYKHHAGRGADTPRNTPGRPLGDRVGGVVLGVRPRSPRGTGGGPSPHGCVCPAYEPVRVRGSARESVGLVVGGRSEIVTVRTRNDSSRAARPAAPRGSWAAASVLEPRPTTSETVTETHPSPLVWSDDDRPSYLAASTDSMAISDWSADTWGVWIVCREGAGRGRWSPMSRPGRPRSSAWQCCRPGSTCPPVTTQMRT
jgi:hypothetical protein